MSHEHEITERRGMHQNGADHRLERTEPSTDEVLGES